MSCDKRFPSVCPPVSPIVCPPIVVVRDHFVPQIVPVIHPIQVVDKVHCVPIQQHIYTYSERGVAGNVTGNVTVSAKSQKKRSAHVSRARHKK